MTILTTIKIASFSHDLGSLTMKSILISSQIAFGIATVEAILRLILVLLEHRTGMDIFSDGLLHAHPMQGLSYSSIGVKNS